MFLSLDFAVAFADLLFNFLSDDVYSSVQVAFPGFGEQVWTPHGNLHGAIELSFGHSPMVMFESHPGVDGPAIEVVELFELSHDAIFEGLSEGDVVS